LARLVSINWSEEIILKIRALYYSAMKYWHKWLVRCVK